MIYDEDDLLPLSALQHLAFCERQCGLIHVEGLWDDNRLTALGSQLHKRTHEVQAEQRDGVLIRRSVPLRSLRLGVAGKADVIEFYPCEWEGDESGARLSGLPGRWRPFPVEYKRGRPKPDRCDEVQLCAQALCLEEMLGVSIPEGALYYGEPRRRTPVAIAADLRAETEALALRLQELVASGRTPAAIYETKCRSCSLLERCLPQRKKRPHSASRYLRAMLQAALEPGPEGST